jgi:hypothetical protein
LFAAGGGSGANFSGGGSPGIGSGGHPAGPASSAFPSEQRRDLRRPSRPAQAGSFPNGGAGTCCYFGGGPSGGFGGGGGAGYDGGGGAPGGSGQCGYSYVTKTAGKCARRHKLGETYYNGYKRHAAVKTEVKLNPVSATLPPVHLIRKIIIHARRCIALNRPREDATAWSIRPITLGQSPNSPPGR